MDIRPATIADIPALHRLVERAYRGDSARKGWTHEADLLGGQRTDVNALGDMFADPMQQILLAIRADGLVGCVQVSQKNADTAYLGLLSVDPASARRSIASDGQHRGSTCAVFRASLPARRASAGLARCQLVRRARPAAH